MNISQLRIKNVIAKLSISKWTGNKIDSKGTEAVEKTFHTGDRVGNFHKDLIDSAEMANINNISYAMRGFHNTMTLPWGDNGERILPRANFDKYQNQMREYKEQFDTEVAKFVAKYDTLKVEAKEKLNGLYNEDDYPSDVASKFEVRKDWFPIPDESDIRIDLPETDLREIRRNLRKTVDARFEDAIQDLKLRCKIVLEKMIDKLQDKKAHFRDSLVNNIRDLLELIPKLNITNDTKLNEICARMNALLVSPDDLRGKTTENKRLRKEICDNAKKIMDDLIASSSIGKRVLDL